MNKKTFSLLAVATVLAVAFAVFAIMSQPRIESPNQGGQVLFPNLVRDIEHVKTVVIHHAGQTMSFDRDAKGWHFRERNNYLADGDKVTAMILHLARLTKLEPTTHEANRYDRLDLGDPNKKDGAAKQVTVLDTTGKEMADVVVGKRKFTLGGREGGTYVRVIGDPQTWLTLGDVMVGDAPHDWLKRDLLDVKENEIKRVTIVHPNGEKIVVAKAGPTATSFTIENLPKGAQLSSDYVADDYGRVLANLMLDDVSPAASVAFPKDKTTTATIDGDGFQVVIETFQDNDKTWMSIKGSAPEAKAEPAKAADSKDVKPADAKPAEPPTVDLRTDWAKTMAELNAKADGWVFEVPNYEVAALMRPMADMLKKPEPKGGAKTTAVPVPAEPAPPP